MSLGDQQWYPTSAQVTLLQARHLRIKGKNGTNDAYAIMQVGKDKFSTSVVEKCVSPEWKEEATFDLPLFHHQGNAERCTLYIIAMHRALVGLDKFLGQAVINLLDLHANRSCKKTDWYKLVDKNGKQEKDRGEVLLDIQFMRNNMTASMFDLSMADKPRSGLAKLKDKIRGKKKDGFLDSASAIVPSSVASDSEEEDNDVTDSPKKKSKLKTLFGPKTNLQRNVSQSMFTLGALPEKNGSLSSSKSSGLNVESPDVKKKFKILGHKRTSSTDSKVSLGPFSLLSRSKQNIQEQNNLCINGNHVYAEDQEPKPGFGSELSLNSLGKGSVEDVCKYHRRNTSDVSIDSFKGLSVPSYKPEVKDKASQRPLEDKTHLELEEENTKKPQGRSVQEMLDRQEEQERRRQQEREKKQVEENRRLEEQEKKRKEEEEQQRKRREQEAQRAEEQRHREESRVTERLSSFFGIGKKKEERKEEASPQAMIETKHLDISSSTNRFEEIPLTPEPSALEERFVDPRRGIRIPLNPTPPSRLAKVSAVKPRLSLSVLPEPDNSNSQSPSNSIDTHSTIHSSPLSPSLPSDLFESMGMFSDLHSSLAPGKPQRSYSESPRNSMENLSGVGSAPKIEKKRRAPLPPDYPGGSSGTGSHHPDNGGQVQTQNSKDGHRPTLPLPDYESLYLKKRHGVMSQTLWEHVIAEVNQRNWDLSEEINVDGPEQSMLNKSVVLKDITADSRNQHQKSCETPPPATLRHKEALIPPKATASAIPKPLIEGNVQYSPIKELIFSTVNKPGRPASKNLENIPSPTGQNRHMPQETERKMDVVTHQPSLSNERPTPAARAVTNLNSKADKESNSEDVAKEMPSVKPRQCTLNKDPVIQVQPDKLVTTQPLTLENNQVEKPQYGTIISASTKNGPDQWESFSLEELDEADHSKTDMPEEWLVGLTNEPKKGMIGLDPFPNDNLISNDPWTLPQQSMKDDPFTGDPRKMENWKDQTLNHFDDKDNLFANAATTDPFAHISENSTPPKQEPRKSPSFTDQARATFQRNFSLKKKNSSRPNTSSGKALTEKSSLGKSVSQSSQDADDVELTVTSFAPLSRTEPTLMGGSSGGKTALHAWVSPSEAQPVTLQGGSGSAVSNPRRPHPVKPMSLESQALSCLAVGKDMKTIKEMAEKSKNGESGPYTQLTQEELITLVVKQQAELSKKDTRIYELEDYIDNLLVRVMEEKPSILLSLQSKC
ncbi:rab11 family-interacting protein 1-like [Myxocyprinus asiaticus]|uniref:rab11 family-interacting protein 1-like n=1 Tax=Myxocyprinus asiaticus TaxID=70543 RepID=UPI00222352CA|nr:rab11 family-interacting protein 1-like [Myxocyprinus asiaticus]